MHVFPVNKGHGDAGSARTTGSADAVEVGLVVLGNGVVDDVRHIVNVDSAGCDIGRDEDFLLAGLERGHRTLARLLTHVAVHGGGTESAIDEFIGDLGCASLRPREDDNLFAALRLQNSSNDFVLVEVVGAVDNVLDVGLSQTLVGVGRTNVNRLRHEPASEGNNRAGHRCREQHGVTRRGRLSEKLLDVAEEAQVEHAVGFIEHHDLNVLERQQPLIGEIEQAAGGANNNLGTCLDEVNLVLVGFSAVNCGNLRRPVRNRHLNVFRHLNTQFTSGNNDESLHPGFGVSAEALNEGKAKTEGLPGSRLRLPDDVLALKRQRDRLFLDRKRVNNAMDGECIGDVAVDAEFTKSHKIPNQLVLLVYPRPVTAYAGGVAPPFWKKSRPTKPAPTVRSRDDDSGRRIEFTDLAPEPSVFLGQSAYLFLRYAESAARHAHDATDLESEAALASVAEECFRRFSTLAVVLDRLKVDRVEAMSPFIVPTREFERRTRGNNWTERVACTWVTMAFLQDVWRRLAEGLPAKIRKPVVEALADDRMIDILRAELERRIELEPGIRPVLAMWARRLVGDTMLMAESALAYGDDPVSEADGVEPVFTDIISAHSRRMDALGLTA